MKARVKRNNYFTKSQVSKTQNIRQNPKCQKHKYSTKVRVSKSTKYFTKTGVSYGKILDKNWNVKKKIYFLHAQVTKAQDICE